MMEGFPDQNPGSAPVFQESLRAKFVALALV